MLILSFILITLNIVTGAWWVLHGNILFHTDIARDFLLIEDIVIKKIPVLIGPRSGAIPGVFHGPLWLYLNLPSFVLGRGNPVVVGWFWVILSIVSVFFVYWVGKKMFNTNVGLLSAVLLSLIQAKDVKNLFNPYGALMLAPLFFYFLYLYFQSKRIWHLVLAIFLLGLTIQFQMAFGVPILILMLPILIYFLIKGKKLWHTLSFFVLLPPLSTYILFDIRHSFLQIKSVYNYLFGTETHGKVDISLIGTILSRIKELFINGVGMITGELLWINLLISIIFGFILYKQYKKHKLKVGNPYLLFLYFYLGFWLLSIAFKGPVWSYYYWPFLPLLILIFASFINHINKYLFYILFSIVFLINFIKNISDIRSYNPNYLEHGESSWLFNYNVAKTIYSDAKNDFGYFIFTPDLYGYYPRYAMNYVQRLYPSIKASPFEKKSSTYLLIAPPPSYGQDPQSLWYQKNTNSDVWKRNDLKITKAPIQTTTYQNGFKVEKYALTQNEIKIEANPLLIKDLIFR